MRWVTQAGKGRSACKHPARAFLGFQLMPRQYLAKRPFHGDLMRLGADNGPANMAAVKHMSLNLIRNVNDKASIKARTKTLAWHDQYPEKAITSI